MTLNLRTVAVGLASLLFASSCSRKVEVEAVRVKKTKVESTVSTVSSGSIEARQMAVLSFGVQARISKVHVRLGDRVKQGQLLAEVDSNDVKSIFEDARSEWKRNQELFGSGLISKAALDAGRKNYEIARSTLDKASLRAPFDGLVSELNLQVGELSQNATKSPLRIVDLGPRIIRGDIDEVDLGRVRIGQVARVRIPALQNRELAAVVDRVVPYVSTSREQDRSSQIELRLTDANQEVPVGASADIEIVVDSHNDATALPTRAIQVRGKERYVFKVASNNQLENVSVKMGVGNYERSEVISGLKENDLVVLPSDDVELKSGLKVRVKESSWP